MGDFRQSYLPDYVDEQRLYFNVAFLSNISKSSKAACALIYDLYPTV